MHSKIKVRARPGVLVPHHESAGSSKRFIGQEWDEKAHGYIASKEPVEVPSLDISSPQFQSYWQEYRREVQDGALLPADEESAKECGVAFDATFAGAAEKSAASVAKTPAGDKAQ